MKKLLVALTALSFILTACEKDEGKLPQISFKSGGSYLSSNDTLPIGSTFTIGIDASKSEDKDVLKKFNISKTVNQSGGTIVFDETLSGSKGDNYTHDYVSTVDSVAGQNTTYIFTITNRDGLSNNISLTITGK